MSAPMVFQCGACHRVVSDSNQLIAAVAELDALVLDAVVGVSVVKADEAFATVHCIACQHPLGRCYSQPPQPSLMHIVHREDTPRYALLRASLESYVLGSAKVARDDADSIGGGGGGKSSSVANGQAGETVALFAGGPDAAAPQPLESLARIEALESSEADARLQLAQLMRVVLALDQRLRSLEGSSGEAALEPERKRQR